MKRIFLVIAVLGLFGLTSCSKKNESNQPVQNLPAGTHAVKVLDNMDAAGYTYLQVDENGNQYWIAAPQTPVNKGEIVYYTQGMEMKNFHSNTLNRTFDSIFFVQSISKEPSNNPVAAAHAPALNIPKEQISISPLKGGKTIAEIFSQEQTLAGKTIRVKGKVVKFNPNILDRNWIHIQDGTASGDNFDLLVTSKETVQVGDVITVEGTVAINKDFGAGYTYPVMIENAKITQGTKNL
ncbi:MAG: hypothetical protein ACYDA4_02175 [Ignavibacteriaceae bacterium]